MNQAIGQMDQVTQQNAALVEESAAAAASMQDQAARLAEVVGVFKLDRHAGHSPAAAVAASAALSRARPAISAPASRRTTEPVSADTGWEEF